VSEIVLVVAPHGDALLWTEPAPPGSPFAGLGSFPAAFLHEADARAAGALGASPAALAALRALAHASACVPAEAGAPFGLGEARRVACLEDPASALAELGGRLPALLARGDAAAPASDRPPPRARPGLLAGRDAWTSLLELPPLGDPLEHRIRLVAAPPGWPRRLGGGFEWRPREAIGSSGPVAPLVLDAIQALEAGAFEPPEAWALLPEIQLLPLRTPTLPPATQTNAYLLGSAEALLVEPASEAEAEGDRLERWLERQGRRGVEPIAMLITHHHADHIGGVARLAARRGLPLWAHAATAERLPGLRFERRIEDGERLRLGGGAPMILEALHTPGHAPGHLCLWEPERRALVVGDMVAGQGTILIEPGDGDMALYLASLRRLRALDASLLLPAHGPPMLDPGARLGAYLAHRLAREAKIEAALGALGAAASMPRLLSIAYEDAPEAMLPLAALSAEAHLIKLEAEGRAHREGGGWSPGAGGTYSPT